MKMTKDQFERACREFKKHAKAEHIEAELVSWGIMVYCTEVEMYRIAEAYGFNKVKDSWGYSENLKTFYYRFNLMNFDGMYETEGK